jgi:hypothetical protein
MTPKHFLQYESQTESSKLEGRKMKDTNRRVVKVEWKRKTHGYKIVYSNDFFPNTSKWKLFSPSKNNGSKPVSVRNIVRSTRTELTRFIFQTIFQPKHDCYTSVFLIPAAHTASFRFPDSHKQAFFLRFPCCFGLDASKERSLPTFSIERNDEA